MVQKYFLSHANGLSYAPFVVHAPRFGDHLFRRPQTEPDNLF